MGNDLTALLCTDGIGGAASDILYNFLAKVIITERGLDSYATCRFHKYGCPNNTTET